MRIADPAAAASEWDSEFRDDLSGLFDGAVIDRAVDHERPLELPPRESVAYKAYTDSSGGASSGDAYAFCIGHNERDKRVIDVVRGRTGPFNPRQVVEEYAALCRDYRVTAVVGDRYGKELNQQLWRDQAIEYAESKLWAWESFLEALVPFNQGLVYLPPSEQLISELKSLQRVANRTGRERASNIRAARTTIGRTRCAAAFICWARRRDLPSRRSSCRSSPARRGTCPAARVGATSSPRRLQRHRRVAKDFIRQPTPSPGVLMFLKMAFAPAATAWARDPCLRGVPGGAGSK
jgi:hypothetical protein